MSHHQKIAFITGITGQDGSYLAELLLEKQYKVYGMIRRSSSINTKRIDHIFDNPNLRLFHGDLTDTSNIVHILTTIKNENKEYLEQTSTSVDTRVFEIYNLGAQSHVKVSFEMPEFTAEIDAMGVLRILEAIRICNLTGTVRFYQASTSEMFGLIQNAVQSELTPFYPRSPYAVSKLFGHWMVINYREAYGMFASSSVLFNHETVAGNTPLIFKMGKNVKEIDIKPISEIVKYHTVPNIILIDERNGSYQEGHVKTDLHVWDNSEWTKVKFASGYKHDVENNPKYPKIIISKKSCYMATNTHNIIMEDDSEKEIQNVEIDDKVKLVDLPKKYNIKDNMDEFEAEFMGLIVGDGYIDENGRYRFINSSEELRNYVVGLYEKICEKYGKVCKTYYFPSKSGFDPEKTVGYIHFNSSNWFMKRTDFYNEDKTKRVPKCILNTTKENKLAFLKGYNKADGLKAGRGIYEFKNFKTNSITLASGLIYLLQNTTEQEYNINVERRVDRKKDGVDIIRLYYSINVLSNTRFSQKNGSEKEVTVKKLLDEGMSINKIIEQTKISDKFIKKIKNGEAPSIQHKWFKETNTVKKIIEHYSYTGWFYDLETESGTFHCGIGQGLVHNSPRRGETFVTRKITIGLGNILRGKQDCITLGNLNSKRDWGHAKNYVRAMWMILQADKPADYVIASGEQHTVREFVEICFRKKGFNILWSGEGLNEIGTDEKTGKILIRVDEKYFRPSEVDDLLGDATKAHKELGWYPEISFEQLIDEMLECDCP